MDLPLSGAVLSVTWRLPGIDEVLAVWPDGTAWHWLLTSGEPDQRDLAGTFRTTVADGELATAGRLAERVRAAAGQSGSGPRLLVAPVTRAAKWKSDRRSPVSLARTLNCSASARSKSRSPRSDWPPMFSLAAGRLEPGPAVHLDRRDTGDAAAGSTPAGGRGSRPVAGRTSAPDGSDQQRQPVARRPVCASVRTTRRHRHAAPPGRRSSSNARPRARPAVGDRSFPRRVPTPFRNHSMILMELHNRIPIITTVGA